jgi:DNA adenine methylase
VTARTPTEATRVVAPPVAPLLKWPGGKTRELPTILGALPDDLGRLVDPFVGGGAVLFALPPTVPAAVNDASADLVDLYHRVGAQDPDLLDVAGALGTWWDALGGIAATDAAVLVDAFRRHRDRGPTAVVDTAAAVVGAVADAVVARAPQAWSELRPGLAHDLRTLVPAKLGRMRAGERRRGRRLDDPDVHANVEGALRAALYTRLRTDYNTARDAAPSARQAARFLFLREYAYAAMFRFNRRGEFNVPYGGISYNGKSFADRVAHLRSPAVRARLEATRVSCGDFEDFLDGLELRDDDVVFLDPPYDSDFSAYDRRRFGPEDHARLAATVRRLPCRFQLVVKDTPLVRELYCDPGWRVEAFDHTYAWTIKDRNDRRATHLVITDVDAGVAATR